MRVTALETMLVSIEGEMALSVLGNGRRKLFQVWFFLGGRDHRGTGASLQEAIDRARTSGELEKKCTRCKKLKPLRDFPQRKGDSKDGRASHCLECDRKRKAKWYPRASRKIRIAARAVQARVA